MEATPTPQIPLRAAPRVAALAAALLILQLSAQAQTTLTGIVHFSATSNGTATNSSYWNTLGGDGAYDLWLAADPKATSPVNGPSDEQSAISIPLEAGNTYKFYTFGRAGSNPVPYTGINLFFDANNSTPGISAAAPLNSTRFFANSSTTDTLEIQSVAGSGTTYYQAAGVVVVLAGFSWNQPASVPGDVCQPYSFAPGTQPVYFGSFSLQVFPAASLTLGQSSGSPFSKLGVSGTGFSPQEAVSIFSGNLGSTPLATVTADLNGAFSAFIIEPQHHYGAENYFVLGAASGKLGAALFYVTPGLTANPESVNPGATTVVQGFGFGAGETVSVYLNAPRVLLGSISANILGSFITSANSAALQVTIPITATPGTNGLIGIGSTTGAIGIGKLTVK